MTYLRYQTSGYTPLTTSMANYFGNIKFYKDFYFKEAGMTRVVDACATLCSLDSSLYSGIDPMAYFQNGFSFKTILMFDENDGFKRTKVRVYVSFLYRGNADFKSLGASLSQCGIWFNCIAICE
jgi:hypothetical protein